MSIDHNDPRSPYRQIADDLREEIHNGSYPPGSRLPSERELVGRYGVAHQTVRQALALLKSEGTVESQRGRGVFVRKKPPIIRLGSDRYASRWREKGQAPLQAEAEARGLSWRQDLLELGEVPAPSWIAQWFGIKAGEPLLVRRRRHWIEGEPVKLADSYYLPSDVRGTRVEQPDTGPGGWFERFEELGLPADRLREEIQVRMPTPEEASLLRITPQGTPVAEVRRVTYTNARDVPIEVARSVMVGSAHVFAYEFAADTGR